MNIFKSSYKKFKDLLLDMLYPKHIKCIICQEELNELNNFDCCENCFKNLPRINEDCCYRCGNAMPENSLGVCKNCKANNFDFDLARAVFSYQNEIRSVIYKLKYNSAKYLAEPLAYQLYAKFNSLNWKVDIVTSVPLHANRQKARGYNQSSELAKEFCRLTKLKFKELAVREIDNPSQTELNLKDRKNNVKDIFRLTNEAIKGKSILIIDDVYTTGATVNELAKLLKKANAIKVYILTLAHSVFDEFTSL